MKKLAMIMMSVAVMLMFYASAVPHHHHHHEQACFEHDFDAHEDEGCDDEETVCVAHESYVISHDCSDVDFFPVFVVVLHPAVQPTWLNCLLRHVESDVMPETPVISSSGLRAPPCRFLEA